MNKKVLNLANKKIKLLLKQYDGFNTVFLDDWRGFRFIYDCNEIKKYPGKKFLKSRLYKILGTEPKKIFSAGFLQASDKDKRLFGKEYFLNCKTYQSYVNCYVNFFVKKVRTKSHAAKEVLLLKNMKIIFSRNGARLQRERLFRSAVAKTVLAKCSKKRLSIFLEAFRGLI